MLEFNRENLKDYQYESPDDLITCLEVTKVAADAFSDIVSTHTKYGDLNKSLREETEFDYPEVINVIEKITERIEDPFFVRYCSAGILQAHKLLGLQHEIDEAEMPRPEEVAFESFLDQLRITESRTGIPYFQIRSDELLRHNLHFWRPLTNALEYFRQESPQRASAVLCGAVYLHDLLVQQNFLDGA